MNIPFLPKNIKRITRDEEFHFSCHPGVTCFTQCCRQLDLALTPYDVLRLRQGTGLRSAQLLEQYIIMEQEEKDPFPNFYLTMVDDGHASCVFVTDAGCQLYENRPGACRAYPLGRAAICNEDGSIEDFFVLIKEDHCEGFAETSPQNATSYSSDQGLESYNTFNDATAAILQHDEIRQGRVFTPEEIACYVLALYNIDVFRDKLMADQLPGTALDEAEKKRIEDDEQLLLFGISWLKDHLFSSK